MRDPGIKNKPECVDLTRWKWRRSTPRCEVLEDDDGNGFNMGGAGGGQEPSTSSRFRPHLQMP